MATNEFDTNTEKRLKLSTIWDDTKSLVTDFEQLLKSAKLSDVQFIVGENEQEFRAHGLFLKARCLTYIQDDKCLDTPIYKQNWRSEVFEKVLKYIYTGKVNSICICNQFEIKPFQN